MNLQPVESCDVLVLVDNVSDLLSTVPKNVLPETVNVFRAGATELSGRCLCCAQWGLSLVITTRLGDSTHTLLFDSGPEGDGLQRNADRLGLRFGQIEAAVFSHGHWDHVGGMLTALRLINDANGRRKVPVHVNAGMFASRAMRRPDGGLVPFEDVPPPAVLENAGGSLVISDDARVLCDGHMYLSGEIERTTSYEKGLPGHVCRTPQGGWQDDPLILDERFLAVNVRGKGILVFTACSHAGVVNVLRQARGVFAPVPLYGVMGGFHLSGAACEAIIPETVADVKEFNLEVLVPGHCTGWRAIHKLVDAIGESRVVPSAVGRLHRFG